MYYVNIYLILGNMVIEIVPSGRSLKENSIRDFGQENHLKFYKDVFYKMFFLTWYTLKSLMRLNVRDDWRTYQGTFWDRSMDVPGTFGRRSVGIHRATGRGVGKLHFTYSNRVWILFPSLGTIHLRHQQIFMIIDP